MPIATVFSKFGSELTCSIRILSASLIVLCLLGCRPQQVQPINFIQPSKVAPTPAAWQYVTLGEIRVSVLGSDQSRFISVNPAADLRSALIGRFGVDARRPVRLISSNVEIAVGTDGFGLRGDFYLQSVNAISSPIHVEHSVVARGNGGMSHDVVYSRLIVDVCDAILSNRTALAFLQSPPGAWIESALADPKNAVGPVTLLAAEKPPLPTGRIVWGTGDSFVGVDAMLLLGDNIVAGAGAVLAKSNKIFSYRMSALLGGGGAKGGGSGAFMFNIGGDLLVGYRHTVKNDKGYVDYPGVSFGVGPSINPMFLMGDGFSMTIFPIGGKAVIDLPFGRKFGLSAGYWLGASIIDISAGSMSLKSVSFSQAPLFDLWLDLGGSRISLGSAFQAMGEGSSAFKNPMFNLSFTESQGRGVGKSEKSVVAAGSTLVDEKKNLATPVNLFQSIPPTAAPGQLVAPPAPLGPAALVNPAPPPPAAYGPQAPPASPPQFGAPMPIPDPQCTEHCQQTYVACAQVKAAGCALGGQLAGQAVAAAADKVPGEGVGAVAGALAAELTQEQCNALLTPCEDILRSCIASCPTVLAPTAVPQGPVLGAPIAAAPGPQALPTPGPQTPPPEKLRGVLRVFADKPRMIVYLNSERMGSTPEDVFVPYVTPSLPVGTYWVKVASADGQYSWEYEKVIVEGEVNSIEARMVDLIEVEQQRQKELKKKQEETWRETRKKDNGKDIAGTIARYEAYIASYPDDRKRDAIAQKRIERLKKKMEHVRVDTVPPPDPPSLPSSDQP
jgi:hypothetical protein